MRDNSDTKVLLCIRLTIEKDKARHTNLASTTKRETDINVRDKARRRRHVRIGQGRAQKSLLYLIV